jgi:hypothetical protein
MYDDIYVRRTARAAAASGARTILLTANLFPEPRQLCAVHALACSSQDAKRSLHCPPL